MTAVIWPGPSTTKLVAATPANVTAVAPVSSSPAIVTVAPTAPLPGLKPEIAGGSITVNVPAASNLPSSSVTVTVPVVAAAGTLAVICVPAGFTKKVGSGVPLKATLVVPRRPVPVIVTVAPAPPFAGSSAERKKRVNGVALGVEADPFTTLIVPFVSPVGTVAAIWLPAALTVNEAAMPLNVTAVAPVKPDPSIVTRSPARATAGANPDTVKVTAKLPLLSAAPSSVVTRIFPAVAPGGTVARSWVGPSRETELAGTPLKVTPGEPPKPVPLTVTTVPVGPPDGAKPVTFGSTTNGACAIPPGVVSVTRPVVASDGTVARTVVELTYVGGADTPLNVTPLTPLNVVPVIVTTVPVTELDGVTEAMVGSTLNETGLVAVPPSVVTVTGPVVATAGTCV